MPIFKLLYFSLLNECFPCTQYAWFRTAFSLLFWVLGYIIAPSQPVGLFFHHLNTDKGLSQSFNSFIHRDREGFVWISSTDGLNRFDGQSIRVYHSQAEKTNSMMGNNLQSPFFEDSKGNLWFCTFSAINCYRRITDDFAHFQLVDHDGLPIDNGYYIFHRESTGHLWIKVNDLLFRVAAKDTGVSGIKYKQHYIGRLPGTRCFTELDAATGKVKTIFSCFLKNRVGFDEYAVEADSIRFVRTWLGGKKGQLAAQVYKVIPDERNQFWAATDKGLVLIDRSTGRTKNIYGKYGDLDIGTIRGITKLHADRFFVASEQGLLLFDVQLSRYVGRYGHEEKNPNSLPSNNLYDVYFDAAGVLWAVIWANGVHYAHLKKVKFSTLDANAITFSNEIPFVTGPLTEDLEHHIWCGSNMATLRKLAWDDKKKNNIVKHLKNYHALQIRTLINGDILLSSYYEGAYWYDVRKKAFMPILTPGFKDVYFEDFIQLRQGKIIAAGPSCLFEITNNGTIALAKPYLISSRLDSVGVQKLYQDNDGRLYAGLDYRALAIFEVKNNQFKPLLEIPVAGEVKSFFEDENLIWVGGEFGLAQIKKKDLSVHVLGESDGFLNTVVYGILSDNSNNLWFSTNRGILCYRANKKRIQYYGLADGLQDFEFNTNSFLKTSDGRLWFGGIKGFNIFHPDSIQDLTSLPLVQITGLRVNDQEYYLPFNVTRVDSLEFEYDENTISLEFVALEFSDPANNKLQYQLEHANGKSYDKDWVQCKDARGFARYAKLPPGEYVLKIKGANSDGVWNETPRRLFIKIHPPFWLTWWFVSLMTVLAGALIVLAVRAYIRNKLKFQALQLREQQHQIEKQEALTQERNRIAAEMHDDLGGGLTSIRVLSERVQNKIDDPNIRKSVDKIAAYSHELVLKMSEIIWAMNSNFDTLDNLIAYIRNYAVRYLDENGIRCIVHRPDAVPELVITGERRRNLYLAVKESLHNIVKHAGADRANIDFVLNGKLEIRVQDNGKGIDLEQLNQFGNGLHNMQKRLESIGGSMEVFSREGTLLVFTVPIKPD